MEARVRSVAWSKVSIRCEGNLAPEMPTRDDADDADDEDDDDDDDDDQIGLEDSPAQELEL